MSISAGMVKELRERTGSGMMECKKALVEANGDLELAIENMRKAGLAKADKKSGRIAAEGLIGAKIANDGKTAAIVDLNCETDFVAKGEDFIGFLNSIATALLTSDVETPEQLQDMKLESGKTVDEVRRELIAKLGENITIRRFETYKLAEGGASCYLHGSKIGVLVELAKADDALGKDIAMHVAACKPVCVSDDQVSQDEINKEKDIFSAQALESGKPAEIIEKMISGRISKFLAEITLLGQPFVKDDKTTVGQLLKSKGNSVVRFTRFEVGEGIEKKEENFAEEVMAQVRGA
ncbi:MAG: translation elongation factor Ts [Methylicorpusculum sp.]|uniref:translation elongation factor Ts n=2 Tax=Methylicorpusculum sp. TaxID=2713644 RepID=UPI00271FAEF7|nr:translation elongation factor Ts [Methylicorpusculum sp.]MDO8844590.1 translation elongation factor Ts [Methylicorpusculum sp.]MDO8941419.1 translation elongation factor Ts [Methylicorpusculum sp.]MDO9239864.1 translation elongation factor Ts [Methylicorpusculum sp.]MDP2178582.1 translation elongation factor Ts [Methylicorpusculum sp.]MDP2202983.1 translation elongation factor Ts [Methylicorpusculum sp.]